MLNLAADNSSAGSGPGWFVALLAVATIFGGIAAVQQLGKLITGRRKQRALDQVLESLADRIDAKATREEAQTLRQRVAELRDEVDEQLPLEARRLYLMSRVDALVGSIGEQYAEYGRLNSELETAETTNQLSPEIQRAIEEVILPEYLARRRRDRRLRVLIGIALLLLVLPYQASPSYLTIAYIDSIFHIYRYSESDLYWLLLIGVIASTILFIAAWVLIPDATKSKIKTIWLFALSLVCLLVAVFLFAILNNLQVDIGYESNGFYPIGRPDGSVTVGTLVALTAVLLGVCFAGAWVVAGRKVRPGGGAWLTRSGRRRGARPGAHGRPATGSKTRRATTSPVNDTTGQKHR